MAPEPSRQEFDSGDALFALDPELRIVSWNRATERLTGTPAEQAIGRRCFEVLGGIEADGVAVCHPGCSYARLVRERRPVGSHEAMIRTNRGARRVSLSTVAVRGGDRPVFLHLMREAQAAQPARPEPGQPRVLSPRQQQVLEFLGEGLRAKEIASLLRLSETTVRNHIHAVLRRLGCHSQLEAVTKAQRQGIV